MNGKYRNMRIIAAMMAAAFLAVSGGRGGAVDYILLECGFCDFR